MSSKHGLIDKAARAAEKLPLPRIVAWMLGLSAAFFALTMPPRLVGRLMGSVGLPGGFVGHGLFTTIFTALLAWVGWRIVSSVAEREQAKVTEAIVIRPAPPRRRPIGAAGTSGEPPMTLRRGDAHPDAPPRRPIFAAHDLGTPFDELPPSPPVPAETIEPEEPMAEVPAPAEVLDLVDAQPEAEPELQPAPEPAIEARELVAVPDDVTDGEFTLVEPAPAEEPLVLGQPLELVPPPPADDAGEAEAVAEPTRADEPDEIEEEERPMTLAALMARFEGGLERLDGDLPPPPEKAAVTPLNPPAPGSEVALRDALAALQRMAARQR